MVEECTIDVGFHSKLHVQANWALENPSKINDF